jgi:hypothetical protein
MVGAWTSGERSLGERRGTLGSHSSETKAGFHRLVVPRNSPLSVRSTGWDSRLELSRRQLHPRAIAELIKLVPCICFLKDRPLNI